MQKYRGAQFEPIKQTKISNLIRLSEVYQNRGLMEKATEYLEQADALMADQHEEMRSPSVSSTSACRTTPASTTPDATGCSRIYFLAAAVCIEFGRMSYKSDGTSALVVGVKDVRGEGCWVCRKGFDSVRGRNLLLKF